MNGKQLEPLIAIISIVNPPPKFATGKQSLVVVGILPS
jgi:hypothetical protein